MAKKSWLRKISKVSRKFGKEITHSKLARAARSPVRIKKGW